MGHLLESPFNGTQLCAEYDPNMFFPNNEDEDEAWLYGSRVKAATRVCKVCPLVTACLEYALKDSSLLGIWGGTDEAERRNIRRRKARK